MENIKIEEMKNSIKILMTVFAMSLVSCVATTDSYGYNDPYYQGYSDGYRDGYYQSPDGYWYAPNVVYYDYNGSYYRNGNVYNYNNRSRNTVIVSPRRSSLQNNLPITVGPPSIMVEKSHQHSSSAEYENSTK